MVEKKHLFTLLCLLLILTHLPKGARAQTFSGGFSFTLPPFDSSQQVFLPEFPAAPIDDFVSSSEDGTFVVGGNPIRFWGVNLTTGACFPEYEQAPAIAARMQKMGINLVRFHHLDNPWSSPQSSIFLQNGSTTTLNPATLDKLHYFIAQLKQHGIYANINLMVSRTFTEADGVLYADSIPEFGKAVTLFDRQLIELQKQYAQQLLGSINPYTELPLAQDPAVAMIEINNENTLYGFWKDDYLQAFSEGGHILSRHADTLNLRWNQFLADKYGSQANLEAAWMPAGSTPPPELISDGSFEQGDINQDWTLEVHDIAQAQMNLSTDAFNGNYAAEIQVSQVSGTDWHVQFEQNGSTLQQDSSYLVRFYARADAPHSITVSVMRNAPPWTWYAGQTIELSTEWQEYVLSFIAPEDNNGLTRLTFLLGTETGTYYFDDISMKQSEQIGLENGENLALQNIRRIRYSERFAYHPQRVSDMAEFYLDLQKEYYDQMYAFLKNELGVQVPITGSNALGGPYESYTHQNLDYIDDHAYWDHPYFPNEAWSPWDWYIENSSLLEETYLAHIPEIFGGYQIAGKPLTISEYNHPFPNRYQSEMLPLLTGYGSLHGADGFMFFEYNGGDPADWTTDLQNNFFGLHRNTPVMSLFPLFAYAFRHGLIAEDPNPIEIGYAENYFNDQLPFEDELSRWESFFPYDNRLGLMHALRIASFGESQNQFPVETIQEPPFTSATGELYFDPGLQTFRIQTESFEAITGNMNQATALSGGAMQLLSGEDFATLAWLSLSDEPLPLAKRSILAVGTRLQNQNMQWDGTTTVHDNWGAPPTEVQALSCSLQLHIQADSIRIFTLATDGSKQDSLTLLPQADGSFLFVLDQSSLQSNWFGIERLEPSTASTAPAFAKRWSVFPSPTDGLIKITGPEASVQLTLYRQNGTLVFKTTTFHIPGELLLPELPKGIYLLKLMAGDGTFLTQKIVIQ